MKYSNQFAKENTDFSVQNNFHIETLQEKDLLDVMELDSCHKCRGPPFEAAIYSLEAEGEKLGKFRADVNAELTVELEEQDKKERSFMELPVDFTKEEVTRVVEPIF